MGAGKTSVAAEAGDLLAQRAVAHAVIDFDGLSICHLPSDASENGLIYRNLVALWSNYAALGIVRLLLAAALETSAEPAKIRKTLLPDQIVICRLTARIETMERRLHARETGMNSDKFLARVTVLDHILDRAALEDFSIATDDRSVTDIAMEMLERAGWV